MNPQKAPYGIEWTRIRLPDGTHLLGWTWNPITGCFHLCAWVMPNGTMAQCYAKSIAESAKLRPFYPQGFEDHIFHQGRLSEPLKERRPSAIFIDSMADLMGPWVPALQITQVLDVCRQAHWHTFFLLTKNAPRLARFAYPSNLWVGVSSPPDVFEGHQLSRSQQGAMLTKSLEVLATLPAGVRWMSFEPLSWDVADIVRAHPGAIRWAVIGAASDGRREYPPDPEHLRRLLAVLDAQGVPAFFKGNMRSLPEAAAAWRDAFPLSWQRGVLP